ncbi:MAG: tetratricopeptide repeat protein [Proteobacteria bacterium]|nr:tetratricopeptide repeat protein [Pseudomonadota bacterium]
MALKRSLRLDQVVLVAIGCLVLGYLLGIATALVIQGKPAPVPGPAAGPTPTVAPPGTALGSMAAEIRELRNIVEKNPDNATAWVRLGNLYFDTDQFMEAIDAYSKSLELQPNDPDVITDRAIMYRRIGDFDQAVADLRRAAEISPTHLNSLLNLGVVLRYDLNDVAGAIQAWKGYLARNPPADMAEKIRKEIETLQAQGQ